MDIPINRGKRCVPPAPGIIPNFVSVKPSFAVLARRIQHIESMNILSILPAIRISHAKANSRPPPNAKPWKLERLKYPHRKKMDSPSNATIVGTGRAKIFEKISLIFETNGPTSSCGISNRSFRSAPKTLLNIHHLFQYQTSLPAQNTFGTKLRKRTHRVLLFSFKLSIVASN